MTSPAHCWNASSLHDKTHPIRLSPPIVCCVCVFCVYGCGFMCNDTWHIATGVVEDENGIKCCWLHRRHTRSALDRMAEKVKSRKIAHMLPFHSVFQSARNAGWRLSISSSTHLAAAFNVPAASLSTTASPVTGCWLWPGPMKPKYNIKDRRGEKTKTKNSNN